MNRFIQRSPLVRALAALAIVFPLLAASGCKSPGEKKYDDAKELRKRNLVDQSIVSFEEAAKLLEEEGGRADKAYYKLASIYKSRGGPNVVTAIDYYRKAIKVNPDDVKYHDKLIGALIQVGEFEEAGEVYDNIKSHDSLKYDIRAKQDLDRRKGELDLAIENARVADEQATTADEPKAGDDKSAEAPSDSDQPVRTAPAEAPATAVNAEAAPSAEAAKAAADAAP